MNLGGFFVKCVCVIFELYALFVEFVIHMHVKEYINSGKCVILIFFRALEGYKFLLELTIVGGWHRNYIPNN